jgi:hypothetical protein
MYGGMQGGRMNSGMNSGGSSMPTGAGMMGGASTVSNQFASSAGQVGRSPGA